MADTYRPRDQAVHARQWTGDNTAEIIAWVRQHDGTAVWHAAADPDMPATERSPLSEHLDLGDNRAWPGDWLIHSNRQWLVAADKAFTAIYRPG